MGIECLPWRWRFGNLEFRGVPYGFSEPDKALAAASSPKSAKLGSLITLGTFLSDDGWIEILSMNWESLSDNN